ncbi:MAG: TylF/MycF family methyltransferase [Actinomycetota bacterium]|nr:TylF/MycF family methyltransferase [Actinomycetota bacterium]
MPETGTASGDVATRELYLDLLKRAVSHTLYSRTDVGPLAGRNQITRALLREADRRGLLLLREVEDPEGQREEGRDWPLFGQTMIGLKRLENLQFCVEDVVERSLPGDLIETGVWRGGATIFMRGILAAHGVRDRTVWAADSFEGLPRADTEPYPADADGALWHLEHRLAISLEEVQGNFERYGLLDDQVRFLKGWFKDTLHTVPDPQWAVIRLDGDMYGSTMEALTALYPNLMPGGYVIVDDYSAIDVCRRAVDDYRKRNGIEDPIQQIDWTGVYWQRSA